MIGVLVGLAVGQERGASLGHPLEADAAGLLVELPGCRGLQEGELLFHASIIPRGYDNVPGKASQGAKAQVSGPFAA